MGGARRIWRGEGRGGNGGRLELGGGRAPADLILHKRIDLQRYGKWTQFGGILFMYNLCAISGRFFLLVRVNMCKVDHRVKRALTIGISIMRFLL